MNDPPQCDRKVSNGSEPGATFRSVFTASADNTACTDAGSACDARIVSDSRDACACELPVSQESAAQRTKRIGDGPMCTHICAGLQPTALGDRPQISRVGLVAQASMKALPAVVDTAAR